MDTTALAAFLDVLRAHGVTEYAGPGLVPGQWVRLRLWAPPQRLGGEKAPALERQPPPQLPRELEGMGLTAADIEDLRASVEG